MTLFSFVNIAKWVKKLIDIVVVGRQAGWWNKEKGPQVKPLLDMNSAQPVSAEVLKVSNGMPHWLAGGLTLIVTLLSIAYQHGKLDPLLFINDPKAFFVSLWPALAFAYGLYLQRPGQAAVMLGSSKDLREEAKESSALKIVVPLEQDGGK